jgi:hypothetical protein
MSVENFFHPYPCFAVEFAKEFHPRGGRVSSNDRKGLHNSTPYCGITYIETV